MAALDPNKLDPAAILGRAELPTDLSAARDVLTGRRILVTGAGGSVGVNLAELLLALQPAQLTLLDHHDHALFSLKSRLDSDGPSPWRLVLADVRDDAKLARVLDEARPDVVFHLAAYKHVPFGEEFPEETLSVNVLATARLLELSGQRGVDRFVYPSSDKAVNPPSLYGATKRLSEVLVQKAARDYGRRYSVVRFVNILGTRGSAIETFAEQLAAGEPLTVTDASMTRYWISMREATWLLVQAATLAQPGAVLMLDARQEVPVLAIARRLQALLAPSEQEPLVRLTGLRPGERLHEELLSANETFEAAGCAGLLEVRHSQREHQLATLPGNLERLLGALDRGASVDELKAVAMESARALQ